MDKSQQIEHIIREYLESKKQISKEIQIYKDKESTLFQTLLRRLEECNKHHDTYPAEVRSEFTRALD